MLTCRSNGRYIRFGISNKNNMWQLGRPLEPDLGGQAGTDMEIMHV